MFVKKAKLIVIFPDLSRACLQVRARGRSVKRKKLRPNIFFNNFRSILSGAVHITRTGVRERQDVSWHESGEFQMTHGVKRIV